MGGGWDSFTSQRNSIEEATATDFSTAWTYDLIPSRLTDFEAHLAAGNRYFTGLFRPEGGAETRLWVVDDWNSFRDQWNLYTDNGLAPIDIDVYTSQDGAAYYSEVFKQGSDAHLLVPPAEWWQFTFLWDQLSDQNWRLVDIESHIEDGKTLFSGAFRAGGGGYGFFAHETLGELYDTQNDMRSLGRELIDFEVIDTASGNRLYSGAFLTSSGNYRLEYGEAWDNFEQTIASMRNEGYELVDLEVSIGGDDVVDPTEGGGGDIEPGPTGGVCFDAGGTEHAATITAQQRNDAGEIIGTPSDDVIVGSSELDMIRGLGGNDIICGREGDDEILGDSDADTIWGEDGSDTIDGGTNEDAIEYIFGGRDDDTLLGSWDDDVLEGGSGQDYLDGGDGEDGADGGSETDQCYNAESTPNCEID